jgi:hypothetical protein
VLPRDAPRMLAFATVTSPLWRPGQPFLLVAPTGALGGLIMAMTVATTSGWALVRLGSAWSHAVRRSGVM